MAGTKSLLNVPARKTGENPYNRRNFNVPLRSDDYVQ